MSLLIAWITFFTYTHSHSISPHLNYSAFSIVANKSEWMEYITRIRSSIRVSTTEKFKGGGYIFLKPTNSQ